MNVETRVLSVEPRTVRATQHDQPLIITDVDTVLLFEPAAVDSFFQWGFFSEVLQQKDKFYESKIAAQRAYAADAFLSGTEGVLWRLFAISYDLNELPDAMKYCDDGARRFPKHYAFARCKLLMFTTRVGGTDVAAAQRERRTCSTTSPRPGLPRNCTSRRQRPQNC